MTDHDRLRERSIEVMTKLFGAGVRGDAMPAREIVPEFFELASTFCFGGFWSRRARSSISGAEACARFPSSPR